MTRMTDELVPLRSAMLSEARSDADRIRADCAGDIDRRMAEAQARAAEMREMARRSGQLQARSAADLELAAASRDARRLVLEARRDAYQALRDAVRERLDDDPRLLPAFARRVHRFLGPSATTTVVPGGIAGVLGSRRVECTTEQLADTALERLGPAVEEMWAS